MTIRRIDPGTAAAVGASQRLVQNDGRIPFNSVDVNGRGGVSKEEIATAVRLNFPGLSDGEAKAIADKAFGTTEKGGKISSGNWKQAENIILREAEITLADKAGWRASTGAGQVVNQGPVVMPPPIAQPQYMPAPTYQGQLPYQYNTHYPQASTDSAGKAAGRGLLGFLKMLPVVGNVINGIDFVKDIGKGVSTWLNPNKSFGEKLKSGADLLFHGVGMIAPQVGAMYDVSQSAVRLGKAALGGNQVQPFNALPQWQFNNGGFNPIYQSPNNYQYQYPTNITPYSFNQFSNYNSWNTNPQTGFNTDGYPPARWQNPSFGLPTSTVTNPGEMTAGAGRVVIGAVKKVPVLGNVLNGIDFVRDLGRVGLNLLTFQPMKALKAGADALFHGAGMFNRNVGANYDIAQGVVRMAAASRPSWSQPYYVANPWQQLPAFRPVY